jgi:hypothetical protein
MSIKLKIYNRFTWLLTKESRRKENGLGIHVVANLLQGCQDFLGATYQNIPKEGKICTYTKLQQNTPNGNKVYQMAID